MKKLEEIRQEMGELWFEHVSNAAKHKYEMRQKEVSQDFTKREYVNLTIRLKYQEIMKGSKDLYKRND